MLPILRHTTSYIRVRLPSICLLRYVHHHGSSELLPIPPSLDTLNTAEDNAEARSWIAAFKDKPIPKSLVNFTFSRSSGPGGQNVNKVNTKSTLRCEIESHWIPSWAKPVIKKSPFYVSSSQSIMITSTVYRSQAQNITDCLQKLHALILQAAAASVRNETSAATRERVAGHERAAKERRKSEKMYRSAIKQSRSNRFD